MGFCLLQRRLYLGALSKHQCRLYALSRFPQRATGFGRDFRGSVSRRTRLDPRADDRPWPSLNGEEKHLKKNMHSPIDPAAGLRRLLLDNDELVITRQLEMLNIFMGFEQSNRYAISNANGESLGYIVEEPRGFFSMFARQVFKTHRSFRALVMDLEGSPVLWIHRPFSWINSRMYVQHQNSGDHLEGEPVLDTFAEVQQEWHLWRRRYNLFLRSVPRRVLTIHDSYPQAELGAHGVHFNQFARVDEGLWAWYFVLRNAQREGIASVDRAFRGLGREVFTDTGRYNVSFRAPDEAAYSSSQNSELIIRKPGVTRSLTVDERALILAMASEIITIRVEELAHILITSVQSTSITIISLDILKEGMDLVYGGTPGNKNAAYVKCSCF